MRSIINHEPIITMEGFLGELELVETSLMQIQREHLEKGTPETDQIVIPLGLAIRHFQTVIEAGYEILNKKKEPREGV